MGASITADRLRHLLYGDATGGGHKVGYGLPGKSKFPAEWSDDEVAEALLGVADATASARRPGRLGRVIVEGGWRGAYIRVIQEADGSIVTGFPIGRRGT